MAAANRTVDAVVENLRTFAGAWAGGVAILESAAPEASPKDLWDSVAFNNDDDRVRVARSQAKLVGAWSGSVSGLAELEAVATHKKVAFPPAYRHFMTRYGSLTLVPRELPSAPLDGLRKWAISDTSLPCLFQLLPAREIRRVNRKPSKLCAIGSVASSASNWFIFLDWRGSGCTVRACAEDRISEGEAGFLDDDFGPFETWLEPAALGMAEHIHALLSASDDRAAAATAGKRLSLCPDFDRATRGHKGVGLVDATVAALKRIVADHPECLLIVEESGSDKQSQRRIATTLGTAPDVHFLEYHRTRLGAWQRSPVANTAAIDKLDRLAGGLPPSYRHFLERYGSLTLLADRLSASVDGFWAGNVGSNGWALLELLDAETAAKSTLYLRRIAKEADCDLSRVLVIHGGFMATGYALHLGTRNARGECAVQRVSDDAVGEYAFDKLSRRERVAPDFATWLLNESRRIVEKLETALGRVR